MFTAYLAKQWTFATPGLYGESCVHIPDAELAPRGARPSFSAQRRRGWGLLGARLAKPGEIDREGRALAQHTLHQDGPAMVLHNPMDY